MSGITLVVMPDNRFANSPEIYRICLKSVRAQV